MLVFACVPTDIYHRYTCSSTISSATRLLERTTKPTYNGNVSWTCRHAKNTSHTYEQAKAMAQAQPFEVHYHPHINVDVTPSWDNFIYEHCTMGDGANMLHIQRRKCAVLSLREGAFIPITRLEDPAPTLPNGIFECQPSLNRIHQRKYCSLVGIVFDIFGPPDHTMN